MWLILEVSQWYSGLPSERLSNSAGSATPFWYQSNESTRVEVSQCLSKTFPAWRKILWTAFLPTKTFSHYLNGTVFQTLSLLWPWLHGKFPYPKQFLALGITWKFPCPCKRFHDNLSFKTGNFPKLVFNTKSDKILDFIKTKHEWSSRRPVDFPHKGPAMQKSFPCHDIINENFCTNKRSSYQISPQDSSKPDHAC